VSWQHSTFGLATKSGWHPSLVATSQVVRHIVRLASQSNPLHGVLVGAGQAPSAHQTSSDVAQPRLEVHAHVLEPHFTVG
jgi:hypothetical protein